MNKFLIIEQDLRVSGTSQGIISRSFLAKLRTAYPDSVIDVIYLKHQQSDDKLHLLPVNTIKTYILNLKIPFLTLWLNKISWRLFHISLKEKFIHKVYRSYIKKIDFQAYDHIFIRSAGLNCETLLASRDLPILKSSIITFNEPYPTFWCSGSNKKLDALQLFKVKEMQNVVEQAKGCIATHYLAQDMQFLYGSRKKFNSLPHQYSEKVFDFSDINDVFEKKKQVTISYHGALQFGRDIDILLDTYVELISENSEIMNNSEFILRLKSEEFNRIKSKYSDIVNIRVLEGVNFSNAGYEQEYLTDINILLENGPIYCSVLLGKAPFLANSGKAVFTLSPYRSELREIIQNPKYIASYNSKDEIKTKLSNLIIECLNGHNKHQPFGDYFSDENFKNCITNIIENTDG